MGANNMRLKSQESNKIKSKNTKTEAKINNAQSTFAAETFALLEKNHKEAEGADPEKHHELENNNFALMKKLLKHFKQVHENKENADSGNQVENLPEMIKNLENVNKNYEKHFNPVRESIVKHKAHAKEALRQNVEREVAIQKNHELDNNVRTKFRDFEPERIFELFANDDQQVEGLEEMRKQFA